MLQHFLEDMPTAMPMQNNIIASRYENKSPHSIIFVYMIFPLARANLFHLSSPLKTPNPTPQATYTVQRSPKTPPAPYSGAPSRA